VATAIGASTNCPPHLLAVARHVGVSLLDREWEVHAYEVTLLVYWLNSHDPDFDAKAKDICQLYLDAPRFHEEGRLVLSSDEKTGM